MCGMDHLKIQEIFDSDIQVDLEKNSLDRSNIISVHAHVTK